MGEYDAALAAYDEALELQPGMPDAEYNRSLVESLKEEQQQQQQEGEEGESGEGDSSAEQQEGDSPQESQGDEGEEGADAEQQEGEQQGEPGQEEGAEQEGEPGTDKAEAWSEEDAQAMEQWLRRIPDDPGGLLRRKFRSQHQSRGAPEDESEVW
jgi:Ca-activated chloride channel family protein